MLHYNAHKLLNAYLDSELAPDVANQVEKHLESCHRCQKELDEFRRLNKAIQSLPPNSDPDSLFLSRQRLKVLDRIRNNQTPESTRVKLTQYPLRWSLVGSTIIVLLLVIMYQEKNLPNFFKQSQQILMHQNKSTVTATGTSKTTAGDVFSSTSTSVGTTTTSISSYDRATADAERRSRELAMGLDDLKAGSDYKPSSAPSTLGTIQSEQETLKYAETKDVDMLPEETKRKLAPPEAAAPSQYGEGLNLQLQKDGTIKETHTKRLTGTDEQSDKLDRSSPVLARRAEMTGTFRGETIRQFWTPEYYSFDFKNVDLKECLMTIATTAQIEIVAIAPREDIKINYQSRKILLEKILGNIKQQTNLPYVTSIGKTFYLTKFPLNYYTQRAGYATSKNLTYVLPEDLMSSKGVYYSLKAADATLCPHCKKIQIQPDWIYCPLDGTKLKDSE